MGGVDLNLIGRYSEFFQSPVNIGKTLFAQLMDFLLWSTFTRIVARYGGDARVRTLCCAEQYRAMAFAQLTYRESLRDIEVCLSAQASELYHMGFREPVRRSTLTDANETRDWRIYAEFAHRLIAQARKLYANESLGLELSNTVYHRSVPVAVSMGALSLHQGGREDAHAARSARQHSELHSHLGRQVARRSRPRSAALRTGRHLRHGSRLRRLRTPLYIASGWRLLRHPRQVEPGCPPRLLRADRSGGRHHCRPDHRVGWLRHQQGLSGSSAPRPLQGPRIRKDAGVSKQPIRLAGRVDLRPLQVPLAGRTVLQMDQAAPSDQTVLRHVGQRGEDANLDRRIGLRPHCHRQEAPRLGSLPLHFAPDFLGHPLRENADAPSTFRNQDYIRRKRNR